VKSENSHDDGVVTLPSEDDLLKKSDSEKPKEPKPPSPKHYMPPLTFPQKLAKSKLDSQFSKLLNVLKKLHVTFHSLMLCLKCHCMLKFERDHLKKEEIEEHETITLGEECSVVVLNKPPTKLKDPDSFSIPCLIENISIDRTLCELASSDSLMPYSIFKIVDLGELIPPIFLNN